MVEASRVGAVDLGSNSFHLAESTVPIAMVPARHRP